MIARRIALAELIAESARRVRAAPVAVGGSLAALTTLGFLTDTRLSEDLAVSAAVSAIALLALGFQLWAMRALMAPVPPRTTGGPAIIGLLLLSIVTTLAVVAGLLMLVLPGVYLAARWRIAVPTLLAEDVTLAQALGESWRRTAAAWLPLAFATALFALPYGVSLVLLVFVVDPEAALTPPQAIAANASLYLATVAAWVLDAAAYRLLVRPADDLAETFA